MAPRYEIETLAACPLCSGRALASLPVPRRTVGGRFADDLRLGLTHCRRCRFEFVSPRPDATALADFYAAQDYTAHEPIDGAAAVRRARIQLDAIEDAIGPLRGASLLDVGCGGGQLLAAARDRGAIPCGYDVALHAQAACRALDIEVVTRIEDLGRRTFDGAVMSHVLEHVGDVGGVLRHLRERTRWLCIEVPNVESLRARLSTSLTRARLGADERHRAFPIHLSYFSPRTLRRALADAGFEVVRLRTAGGGTSGAKRAFHRALLGENLLAIARTARG
ncbi:MAG TPA: class I SAM-dependent methyltransferase [Kofleriaceae bacterium]|nr:class I SAM-dependent methyltransferase [Kofleriaceae bacterium]